MKIYTSGCNTILNTNPYKRNVIVPDNNKVIIEKPKEISEPKIGLSEIRDSDFKSPMEGQGLGKAITEKLRKLKINDKIPKKKNISFNF
tara:strand:- start:1446 stop:1712 length:267 start_codon:yes stop_codon:yes gene_type:complete